MTNVVVKKRQKVTCNACNKLTPYVIKKKKLYGEYEHLFAECEHCQHKETVYYTNKKLRKLLTKQGKETNQSKKELLKDKIEKEMAVLKDKFK